MMCLSNYEKEEMTIMASTQQANEKEHGKIPSLASNGEPNIHDDPRIIFKFSFIFTKPTASEKRTN